MRFKHNKKKKIHLWIPNIFGFKGGIQVYSAFFLEAIQNIYPEAKYDVFLKHDTNCPSNYSYLSQTQFYFAGNVPLSVRTPFFAAQLIGNGIVQKPDLIVTTHLNFTVAAYWLKRLRNIPYWVIAHGVEAWNLKNEALQKALSYANRILAVSNYTRDRLLKEQNLDPNKVVLLPNTFNSDRFQIGIKPAKLLNRYNLKPEQPIILTVNRLCASESYKGYDKILAALPQIRQTIPNVHYIIVGKGDDRPRLEKLIQERNLQDCVTLAGFIPDSQLCNYYQLCDLFVMPSKLEGFGIVYLEALACGKPVLAGDRDGAVDALRNGELGALINPDDTEQIAQTIIQLLQGNYANNLVYQPIKLREKALNFFGFYEFKQTLGSYLEQHFSK